MKTDETLLVEQSNEIMTVTLNRPKLNLFNGQMLDDLIEKVYDGSAMSLVLQALSSGRATKEELEEVRRLLDQMEGK